MQTAVANVGAKPKMSLHRKNKFATKLAIATYSSCIIFVFRSNICYRSQFALYVTVFYLFCYCFPWERVVYYLLETSVILFCLCCFLVLSVLSFLSLALNVGHLVLFLLFYLSLDYYYHFFFSHIKLVYLAFFLLSSKFEYFVAQDPVKVYVWHWKYVIKGYCTSYQKLVYFVLYL